MNGETPRFYSEIESSNPPFYLSDINSVLKNTESLVKYKPKRHLTPFTKFIRRKRNFTPIRKRERNNTVENKGKFKAFLRKRFKLRNDSDEEHADEFLLSEEQDFEFPSRDRDIIS